jgi:DivIVA domain-containing protein
VTLILMYLVVLILVSIVLFGIASFIFGRGEQLPPLPRSTTATVLPASGVTAADVEAVKFSQVLRGYKTSEVDWVLDRLGTELDQLRAELATVRAATGFADPTDQHLPAAHAAHLADTDPV